MLKKIKDRLRNYFIAGLLTVVPLSITVYVISILLTNADRIFNIILSRYNPKVLLPFPLLGLGAVLVLCMIFVIGLLVKNYVGGLIIDFGERVVYQIPLVRPICSAVRQLLGAIFSQSYDGFKRVVMMEHPRQGIYGIGFVTGFAAGEVQDLTQVRGVNVFLPTTPNPTSGFYPLVPEKDVAPLQMSVEGAFKLIISRGLATPQLAGKGLPPRKSATLKLKHRPESIEAEASNAPVTLAIPKVHEMQ